MSPLTKTFSKKEVKETDETKFIVQAEGYYDAITISIFFCSWIVDTAAI